MKIEIENHPFTFIFQKTPPLHLNVSIMHFICQNEPPPLPYH
jgi:hypothetical protein